MDGDFNLQLVFRGIKRVKGDAVVSKLPLTPEYLLWILSSLNLSSPRDANVWAAVIIGFFALLRRSNIAPDTLHSFDPSKNTRRCDIVLKPDRVDVTIRWSKTIQFRERKLVIPIPRIKGSPLCPVAAVHRAFSLTPSVNLAGPAFMASSKLPILVKDVVSAIKTGVRLAGVDPSEFSGHSLRRGGACLCLRAGLSIDAIRQLGDWKSDSYTKYTLENYTSLFNHLSTVTSLCLD